MRITQVSIQNFKGFGERVEIPLSNTTLLFGPNSSGKSSILHAVSYLHSIICARSLNPSSTRLGAGAMDLGGFKQIVHAGDLDNILSLGLTISVDEDLAESDAGLRWQDCEAQFQGTGFEGGDGFLGVSRVLAEIDSLGLEISIVWSKQLQRPVIRQCVLSANHDWLWKSTCSSDCSRKEWSGFNSAHSLCEDAEFVSLLFEPLKSMYQEQASNFLLVGLPRAFDALPDWHQTLSVSEVFDDEYVDQNPNSRVIWKALSELFLHAPLEMIEKALQPAVYIGPLRSIPDRHHQPVFDRDSWGSGLAAWDRLFYDRSLLKQVNGWLSSTNEQSMNAGYEIRVDRYRELDERENVWAMLHSANPTEHKQKIISALEACPVNERLRLLDLKRNVLVYPQDVGVGISQMIPVMVAALDTDVPVAFIEQPELHIHPRLQLELGDLLMQSAHKLNKTLVLETHSEHLILRQLRRIEEGKFSPDSLSVLYVNVIDGLSRVKRLEVNKDGDFDQDWPDGFFDERDKELLA